MSRNSRKIIIRLPMIAGAIAVAGLMQAATVPALAGHHAKSSMSESSTAADVKREWAEAIRAIKGYSAAQRDKAVEEADDLLEKMDSRIETLESRAEDEWKDLGNEARKKRQAALKTLRQQRAELSEWYGGMKHSSGDAWDEVKAGFVDAYEALGKAFSDATKAF
tara:strand:+ start:856 stop:1350 length:495 start_codon:yes stop_codon:yes gene_type:complete